MLPVQLGALPRGWADPMQPVLPCLPDPQPLVAPSQELVHGSAIQPSFAAHVQSRGTQHAGTGMAPLRGTE